MKIKLNDVVRVIAGAHKGKTAKVVAVLPASNMVKLEGLGERKRTFKPSAQHPQGGTKELHGAINASNVALVHPSEATKTTRVGYVIKKDGAKVRVARQAANKEIE